MRRGLNRVVRFASEYHRSSHCNLVAHTTTQQNFGSNCLMAALLTGGNKDALDNLCDSAGSVVVRMGIPHCRQLNSPAAGGGRDRADHQPGDGPKSGVTRRIAARKRFGTAPAT